MDCKLSEYFTEYNNKSGRSETEYLIPLVKGVILREMNNNEIWKF